MKINFEILQQTSQMFMGLVQSYVTTRLQKRKLKIFDKNEKCLKLFRNFFKGLICARTCAITPNEDSSKIELTFVLSFIHSYRGRVL